MMLPFASTGGNEAVRRSRVPMKRGFGTTLIEQTINSGAGTIGFKVRGWLLGGTAAPGF